MTSDFLGGEDVLTYTSRWRKDPTLTAIVELQLRGASSTFILQRRFDDGAPVTWPHTAGEPEEVLSLLGSIGEIRPGR
jgi:hypothetical protein